MAKKLSVTIELEMTVPDDWQIIETTDGRESSFWSH